MTESSEARMPVPMIKFENVHKTFHTKEGTVAAVRGLNFEVPAGEFFTLLGPSGCGKTTTMRMLAGLEKPDSGRISIGEKIVFSSEQRINVPTHKRDISMVFQSYAIWPHMTVYNNVAYPLRVKKAPREQIKDRVEKVLDLVGLGGMGPRQATRLSGGQQQRVAVARALVAEPEVLLLDEPLSNLDAKLRAHMRVELKELQSRIGVTTIYVTHDQQEALAMSDELTVMSSGVVAQRGKPTDIYHRPRNRFTAEFIGTTNLIEGEASGPIVAGVNRVKTPIGHLQVHSTETLPASQRRVLVSIRPEVVHVSAGITQPPVGDVNELSGCLESVVFLGESSDVTVRVGTEMLNVKGVAVNPVAVGTDVELRVEAAHCTVLVDEDPGQTEPGSEEGTALASAAVVKE